MLRITHTFRLLYELCAFAIVNRAIAPLLITLLLLVSAVFVVAASSAAPYIYTFF